MWEARERVHCGSIEEAVRRAMPQLNGAYSLLVMSPRKLIAARDPYGLGRFVWAVWGTLMCLPLKPAAPGCLWSRLPARCGAG